MEIINNISKTLKDDLMVEIKPESKISIATFSFFMHIKRRSKELRSNRGRSLSCISNCAS